MTTGLEGAIALALLIGVTAPNAGETSPVDTESEAPPPASKSPIAETPETDPAPVSEPPIAETPETAPVPADAPASTEEPSPAEAAPAPPAEPPPVTIDARTASPPPPIPPPLLVYPSNAIPGSSRDARMSPHRRLLVYGGSAMTSLGLGLGVASLALWLISEDVRDRRSTDGVRAPLWNDYSYAGLGTGIGGAVYLTSGVVMLALGLNKPRRTEVTPLAGLDRVGLTLRLRF